MSELPLPYKSVNLSKAGFQKIYNIVRKDLDLAKLVASEIDADPKGVLEYIFKLKKKQLQVIENTSQSELRKRAKALLVQLRSDDPGSLDFEPNTMRNATCTCVIE